jgi:flagellar hook-basal body complex protein FliE
MGKDGGEVESDLTSLVPGTTYYYRVAAENDRGIVRSDIKSFKTTGVKPVVEEKKNQTSSKTDTKTVKTADGTDAKKTTSNGGIFASLFGGSTKKTATTEDETTTATKDSLTGSVGNSVKDVTVSVKAVGTAGAHQTIEYKITYKYNRAEAGKKAELQITLPKTVVYIGDTTANELLVAEAAAGARTYILPIGDIKKGDTRSFSLVGMLTADAKKIPQVDAKLSFTTKSGSRVAASSLVAGVASSTSGGSFPGALIMWLIILNLLVVAAIFAVKAKEWYVDAKLRMAEAQNKANEINAKIDAPVSVKPEVPGAIIGVPPTEPPVQPVAPMMPIPMKPKIADVYTPARFNEIGLPGMEVVA